MLSRNIKPHSPFSSHCSSPLTSVDIHFDRAAIQIMALSHSLHVWRRLSTPMPENVKCKRLHYFSNYVDFIFVPFYLCILQGFGNNRTEIERPCIIIPSLLFISIFSQSSNPHAYSVCRRQSEVPSWQCAHVRREVFPASAVCWQGLDENEDCAEQHHRVVSSIQHKYCWDFVALMHDGHIAY